MITVHTNIEIVSTALLKKLEIVRDPRPLLRGVSVDVLNLMTERIHEKGKAADDSAIGTYSAGYLKFRSENGRSKDSKVILSFTRQLNNSLNVVATEKGWGIGVIVPNRNPLANYLNKKNSAKHLASSKKVGTVKNKKGQVRNISNNDLIFWLQKLYKKKIWSPSASEKDYAITRLKKQISDALNS